MKVSTINRKILSFIHLLITHNFSGLAHAIARNCKILSNIIYARGYYLWATLEDVRTGGRCTNKTIASKYKSAGAHAMQNSDYRCLAQIFKAVPLRGDDVYVDVGCGEGRTLTYHASRHFRGKEYGMELDPVFAEIAARRIKRYWNVEIVCGNVLEQDKVVREGTAFFLYNPFGREVLARFLDMIEREHGSGVPENILEAGSDDRCVRLYYFCDYFRSELDERKNWHIIWRGMTVRRPFRDLPATVYEYRPFPPCPLPH